MALGGSAGADAEQQLAPWIRVTGRGLRGASGLDEEHFRATGETQLDPARARAMAQRSLAGQSDRRSLVDAAISVDNARSTITVVVQGEVPLTLLRLLTVEPLRVTAVATAEPRLDR